MLIRKFHILLLICFIAASNNFFAQKRLEIGVEGGVSINKLKVDNFMGDRFLSRKYATLATGISLRFETFKNTFLDLELKGEGYNNTRIAHQNEYSNKGFSTRGDIGAFGVGFKMRYKFLSLHRISIAPHIGFSLLGLNQYSNYYGIYSIASSSTLTKNGITISQYSTYTQSYYKTNKLKTLDAGIDFIFNITNSLSIYSSFYFVRQPIYFATQTVYYYKTNQDPQIGSISYGGNTYQIKIGISWHIFDLTKHEKSEYIK